MKAGWKETTLGAVIAKGETVDPTRRPDTVFTYVDVSSVSNETFEIVQTSEVLGAEAPSRARRLIRSNDVIFATIRPTLKRIAVVPQNLNEQVCSTGYIVLRALSGVHPRFLYHYLFTDTFQGAMESLQTGASYPAVTDGQVRQQPFPLPHLEEQHQIVAVLDEAFEGLARARAHAEANLHDARELFDNALIGIFDDLETTAPRLTLAEASTTFGRGKSRHRPRNAPFLYGGNYPFVQTGDIRNSSGTVSTFTQTYSDQGLAQSKLWPAGTICITIAANIAETAVLGFDACFPDSIIGMVADPKITFPEYVEFMLRYFAAELKALGKGSAQDNINLATFEAATFPFPDIPSQIEVVEKLTGLTDATTQLTETYRAKIERIDTLRQSLLQKAFAGELT